MLGMYDTTYPRHRTVHDALRRQGVEVVQLHSPLWQRLHAQLRGAPGFWYQLYLAIRIVLAQLGLLLRWAWSRPDVDVIWVGFPGHVDVPLAWLIGKLTGVPVVFDAFISWYDTIVRDRKLFPPQHRVARILRGIDRLGGVMADAVVVDTPEHAAFFRRMFRLPADRVRHLPVTADETVFRPAAPPEPERDVLHVLQYAEYTPLHGGEVVLDAAARLQAAGVAATFELIGDDKPVFESLKGRAAAMGLRNVTFRSFMPETELVKRIVAADVALGVFGDGEKAQRVVPNKVVQCLAVGRCVVTGATDSVRAAMRDGEHAVLVPVADAAALADALAALAADPQRRQRIARQGHDFYMNELSQSAVATRLLRLLENVIEAKANPEQRDVVKAYPLKPLAT